MRELLAKALIATGTLLAAVLLYGAGPLGGAVALAQSINGPPGGQRGAEERTPAADGPILWMSFEDTVTVPGQPLSLRLTVLVPTFMPKPPVWPSRCLCRVTTRR